MHVIMVACMPSPLLCQNGAPCFGATTPTSSLSVCYSRGQVPVGGCYSLDSMYKSIYLVMHRPPGVVSNVDAFWFDFVSLSIRTSNLV